MANINSFADNIDKIVKTAKNQVSVLNGIQETLVSKASNVNVPVETADGSTDYLSLPSYNYVLSQLDAVKKSIGSLIDGTGIVSVGDGTERTVKLTTVASAPDKITGLENPTVFSVDPNWWFEDMMFPSVYVSVDLLGKIDNSADRVSVNRVILDYTDTRSLEEYNRNIRGTSISYADLKALLENDNIPYYEDNEIVNLPLSKISFHGNFIIQDSKFISGEQWYYLDTVQYQVINTDADYFEVTATNTLKKGDKVSLDNNLYEILDIEPDEMRVRLHIIMGVISPAMQSVLKIYNAPWQNKKVNVKFSNNEINIIYFKGINEDFNIQGNDWSDPIMFASPELSLSSDTTTDFQTFYNTNIVDWGSQMIGEVKEHKISAYQGAKPNAPVLNATDFSVVQINTQINASLDTDQLRTMSADIQTTKSRLTSLKGTIDAQQTNLQTITDSTEFQKLQNQINQNITNYKQLQTSYRTSLLTLQTLLQENNGVDIKPKYHTRGFFQIPEPVVKDGKSQQVIGFIIAYRYIKEDSTGTDLKTYTYTDQSNVEHTGVFTDWNLQKSETLEKAYNAETGTFTWQDKSISDGTAVNINQIDIPITKGEKLQFKVKSISEAGYPYSPWTSDWSNTVTIDFPSNLSTSSEVENLITDINDENTIITVENQLDTLGVPSHLDDSQSNINSVTGLYFKHKASNISYEFSDPDTGEIRTISVQDALDSIFAFIKAFLRYSDNTQPSYPKYSSISENLGITVNLSGGGEYLQGMTQDISLSWTYSSNIKVTQLMLTKKDINGSSAIMLNVSDLSYIDKNVNKTTNYYITVIGQGTTNVSNTVVAKYNTPVVTLKVNDTDNITFSKGQAVSGLTFTYECAGFNKSDVIKAILTKDSADAADLDIMAFNNNNTYTLNNISTDEAGSVKFKLVLTLKQTDNTGNNLKVLSNTVTMTIAQAVYFGLYHYDSTADMTHPETQITSDAITGKEHKVYSKGMIYTPNDEFVLMPNYGDITAVKAKITEYKGANDYFAYLVIPKAQADGYTFTVSVDDAQQFWASTSTKELDINGIQYIAVCTNSFSIISEPTYLISFKRTKLDI